MIKESLGHYKIIRRIGSGGMGEVYAAEDTNLNRQVAIKVLPEEMASQQELVQRFEREAKAVAALDHANIVTIYSVERVDQLNFITMQLVEGETLSKRIPKRGLPLYELFDVAIQMADAIATAHEHGITHRDLKPDNIMMTNEGRVMILDFGLAKLRQEADPRGPSAVSDVPLTSEGRLIGTMAYMSPEQAEGKPVDHRSDIFSLGIILYELASGEHPFKGDTSISVVSSIVKDNPRPLTELNPGLPRHLDRTIQLALEKNREHRFQSVKDLRNALESLKREVSSSHSSTAEGAGRGRSASLLRTVLIGCVSGLVVASAVLFGLWTNQGLQFDVGQMRRITGAPELEIHPAISPNGEMIVYSSGPAGQRRLYLRIVAGGRPIPLTKGFPGDHLWPQWSPNGKQIAFESGDRRWVVPPGPSDPVEIEGTSGWGGITWSPDGKRIAYVNETSLVVRKLGSPQSDRELVTTLSPNSPSWSPDGSRIAFVSGNPEYSFSRFAMANLAQSSIWIVPASGGDKVKVVEDGSLNVSPLWLDEHHLLFLSDKLGGRDVYMVSVGRDGRPIGTPRRITTGLDAHSFSLSRGGLSRDDSSRGDPLRGGVLLAYSRFTSRANIWRILVPKAGDSISIREAVQVTRGNQVIEGIGISRDGTTLVYDSNQGGNPDIYKIELPAGNPKQLTAKTPKQLTKHPRADFLPEFSPDGKEIAFYSFRNGSRDLYTMTPDGKGLVQVTSGSAQDRYPHWSPDGNSLVFYSDRAGPQEIWIVSRPRRGAKWGAPRRLTSVGGRYGRWSPKEDVIAFSGPKSLLSIPAEGGDPTVLVDDSFGWTRRGFSNWAPDGKTIYVKSSDKKGAGFWAVPRNGGTPSRVVVFDDPSMPSARTEFATDGRHFYFTIAEQQSDVYTLELTRR